jgi:holo-[acyl-carrier protein] synthase
MITGVGHDLTELVRVGAIVQGNTADRFLQKVLSETERNYAVTRFGPKMSRRWNEFVAGRYAAKEAVVKAFGTGIGETLGFHDISIMPDDSGKPVCELTAEAWTRLGTNPLMTTVHVSITHSREHASAVAIVEKV